VLLVQHSRPIASAETEDHRLRRIMLIGWGCPFRGAASGPTNHAWRP